MAASPPDPSPPYAFAGFMLDARRRKLIGPSGETVALPPRVFDTLVYLVENRGELVEKRRLMRAVWGSTVVADNSLDQHISMIRREFAACGVASTLVVTERGRGYRFVGEVVQTPAEGGDAAALLLRDAQPLILRPSRSNLMGAFALLTAALERRTDLAQALAQRALLRALFPLFEIPMVDAFDHAEREAREAIALDATSSTAHHALAYVAMARANWVEARRHFDVACEASGDADARIARASLLFLSVGHSRLSGAQTREVLVEHPHLPLALLSLATSHIFAGDDGAARAGIERVAAIGWPADQTPLAEFRLLLAVRAGRFDEAVVHGQTGLTGPMRTAGGERMVEKLCAALREPSGAPAAITAVRELVARTGVASLGLRNQKRLLVWLTMLGALDEAFELLWNSLADPAAQGTIRGPWSWLWLPEMAPFRRDARFDAVIDRFGFRDYWGRFGPPDEGR